MIGQNRWVGENMVRTGLEKVLGEKRELLKGKKLGLIINHTSVDASLQLSVDRFLEVGLDVKAIFAPEHGFRGNVTAGEVIEDQKDPITGLPVYSLYGKQKRPSEKMLQEIDTLVFDIQDLGVRFYTYIYTLAYCMEEAQKAGVEVFVLDRPNPINGITVDGNIVEESFHSFVGQYGLPIRHGMTVGELALYFNEQYKMNVDLTVVSMDGWERHFWYEETGLHWVMPSPNATGKGMAALYPGTCFFEGTNVSEGRGTTAPFEWIGAPWIHSYELVAELRRYDFQSVTFRPITFTPYTSKHKGELCEGIQIHVNDFEKLEPIEIAMGIIDTLRKLYPDHFEWLAPINSRYFIDLLSGTNELRKGSDQGEASLEWIRQKKTEAKKFAALRKKYLLY
ncbi:exo-beta-N-acetylmuramidase NamZ family protein [Evansella vedderi]|nr:DUF1343 domain-containing protein [Evansella vedderi]